MIDEEITPMHLRCTIGCCEAVYRLEDGKILIIGKKPSAELQSELAGNVAPNEQAIIIDPSYLAALS